MDWTKIGIVLLLIFLVLQICKLPILVDEFSAAESHEPTGGGEEGTETNPGTFVSGSGSALQSPSLNPEGVYYCKQYNCQKAERFGDNCYPSDAPSYEAECISKSNNAEEEVIQPVRPFRYIYLEWRNFLIRVRTGQ